MVWNTSNFVMVELTDRYRVSIMDCLMAVSQVTEKNPVI